MKTTIQAALVTLLLFCCVMPLLPVDASTIQLHAADSPPVELAVATDDAPAPAPVEDAASAPKWLTDLLHGAVTKYPWVMTVISVIGLLRSLVKPVMTWLHSRASGTSDTKDDERLAKVEGSAWYRWLVFGLDYVASVKPLPKK